MKRTSAPFKIRTIAYREVSFPPKERASKLRLRSQPCWSSGFGNGKNSRLPWCSVQREVLAKFDRHGLIVAAYLCPLCRRETEESALRCFESQLQQGRLTSFDPNRLEHRPFERFAGKRLRVSRGDRAGGQKQPENIFLTDRTFVCSDTRD